MIKIAEVFSPQQSSLSKLVKQCGVDYVVGGIGLRPISNASPEDQPWSHKSLDRVKSAYESMGFRLEVIESRPPMGKTKLGLPGRDEEIDIVCELIRNMGALEIPVWDTNVCIQCNKCALVCPHAVIRMKVYDPELLAEGDDLLFERLGEHTFLCGGQILVHQLLDPRSGPQGGDHVMG